jgi:hypothetical protein
MQDDEHPEEKQPRRKGRLWIWFVVGFILVLVCTSVTVTMYPLRPSGDALVACKLWKYYLIEIQRLRSGSAVGPASGSSSAAAMTALQHLLISAAGGVGMLGIGWVYYKVKGR